MGYLFKFRIFLFCIFVFLSKQSLAQDERTVLKSGIESVNLEGLYSSTKSIEAKQVQCTPLLPLPLFNKQHYSEVIGSRTLNSRTFIGDDGEQVIQYCSQKLHFTDKQKKLQPVCTKLMPVPEGWTAPNQEFPTNLFKDGSVALSANAENMPKGKMEKIIFNKNCVINGDSVNISDFTVGEDGMYIHEAIANIDKKIIFNENRIKTDYIINSPVSVKGNELIISEEIVIPEGYFIREDKANITSVSYIVYSPAGKEAARFHAPVYYDAKKNYLSGKYNLIKEKGKTILQIIVPENWLNDPARAYPVTIDPVVTGPVSNYPPVFLDSCVMPSYSSDSMLITIPGGITITKFYITDSYWADPLVGALMNQGAMKFSSPCGTTLSLTCDTLASGYCRLVNDSNLRNELVCCFDPSCDTQSFYLSHHFGRTAIYGSGCNQNSIFYSPNTSYPFSAYIAGRTDEISSAPPWSVYPATVCSDSCTIYLKATAKYGVPPYTMSHPWSPDTLLFGNPSGCTSGVTRTLSLKIPGCPTNCGSSTTLSVPPPVITDFCGNIITGLSPKTITINPVPVATANNISICSGTPVNINISSCVAGSSFAWTGSNGTSGTGNIIDNTVIPGPETINYSITPSAAGCTGPTENVSAVVYPTYSIPVSKTICKGDSIFLQGSYQTTAGNYISNFSTINSCDSIIVTTLTISEISSLETASICEGESAFLQGANRYLPGTYYDTLTTPSGCDSVVITELNVFPLPLITASPDVKINYGDTVQISVSGGTNYVWSTGDSLPAVYVSPNATTTYTVTGTDVNDCSAMDAITVELIETGNKVSVSNIFTPNGDNENDFIFVHGNRIKELTFAVFDRLGEKVFETNDKSVGWDGKHKGNPLNSAVFAYFLSVTFEDGQEYTEKGNITLIR